MTAEEEKILKDFVADLVDKQKPCPPEFLELVNENFWDLVD